MTIGVESKGSSSAKAVAPRPEVEAIDVTSHSSGQVEIVSHPNQQMYAFRFTNLAINGKIASDFVQIIEHLGYKVTIHAVRDTWFASLICVNLNPNQATKPHGSFRVTPHLYFIEQDAHQWILSKNFLPAAASNVNLKYSRNQGLEVFEIPYEIDRNSEITLLLTINVNVTEKHQVVYEFINKLPNIHQEDDTVFGGSSLLTQISKLKFESRCADCKIKCYKAVVDEAITSTVESSSEDFELIPAHELLLSLRSPVFESILTSMKNVNEKIVELLDYDSSIVSRMLDYVYKDIYSTDSIDCSMKLYALSQQFFIEGLQNASMKDFIVNIDNDNVLKLWDFSKQYELSELSQHILYFVNHNMEILLQGIDDNVAMQKAKQIEERMGLELILLRGKRKLPFPEQDNVPSQVKYV